jgi:3-oxoacyl-[acyl-carrier protein] reductase
MTERLAGRVAVITGGAGGIGQSIAARMATEGADIAVADVKPADETQALVEAAGRRFFAVPCDVSSEADVNRFAAGVHDALGPVDIIVNNAAIGLVLPFEEITFEQWSGLFAVNVNGAFLTVKAFLDDLKRSAAGRVINITSTAYWQGPPSFVAYVSTKGALQGFTHTLATDLGAYDVTVNAIAPHLLRTPMTEWQLPDAVFEAQAQHQSIKREQVPDDVAKLAVFLASDEASFITGQVHLSDGGLLRR